MKIGGKKVVYFNLLLILGLCQCRQHEFLHYNPSGGQQYLNIYPNKTYEYKWFRFYDVGPIEDTIHHFGQWQRLEDTLYLNSYSLPDNHHFIQIIKETITESDSITVKISSAEDIPLFVFRPLKIRINDTNFWLKLNSPLAEHLKISVPRCRIKYIYINGYPVYYPKNPKSNYFEFAIKDLQDPKFTFPENTFFLNDKFLVKTDTIWQLYNNKVVKNDYYIRKKKTFLKKRNN